MRIRKLYLKEIGPFDEVEFEFKPQEKGKAEIHILTGPNGSGKTTVLHALASLFCSVNDFQNPNTNNSFIKRFRNRYEIGQQCRLRANFDEGEPVTINLNVAEDEDSDWISSHVDLSQFRANYIIDAYSQRRSWGIHTEFFVAAYSGYRILRSANINAIQELKSDPFSDALDFIKESNNSSTLSQWIANNISKRALEKEKSNQPLAEKFAATLAKLEEAISDIAGYKIEFSIKTTPLSLVILANNSELDIDVLPDGLRSAISWVGDLLMRIDLIHWEYGQPFNLILFLDEIEVHLHPAWQRKVMPAVQKIFPNAQIFLTTHSPFVVNSVDGAAVYELKVKDGKAYLGEVTESKSGRSYQNVLREVFDIDQSFGMPVQTDLDLFYKYRNEILAGNESNEVEFITLAKKLAKESIEQQSVELQNIIGFELRQINKNRGKSYSV